MNGRVSRLAILLLLGAPSGLCWGAGRIDGSAEAIPEGAAPRVVSFRGGPGDARWSSASNWEGGRVPGPLDVARFDGSSGEALVDPEAGGIVAGVLLEEGFGGTVRLGRRLTVTGELRIRGGDFVQGDHVLTVGILTQNGGRYRGGEEALLVEAAASVTGGELETPRNVMRARSLDIRAPGIVRAGANVRLELFGAGTPLTGNGLLDTWTNRPTTVEYTGAATTDLTSAEPARGYREPWLEPHPAVRENPDPAVLRSGAPGEPARLLFGSPESVLTLPAGENWAYAAAIDRGAGFAYFGTDNIPGIVVKVRLSDFVRVGALTLNNGESQIWSAVIDPAGGYAYFGLYTDPGVVVKVRLSDFTRVGALTFAIGEKHMRAAVIDPARGFAYFGTTSSPGIVVKVRLSDFTKAGTLTFPTGENILRAAVIDPGNGFAYFGTDTFPARVVKVRLSDFSRVGALTLNSGSGENYIWSAAIDGDHGYAYFGMESAPGVVVKVRLSDFTRVAGLTLNSGDRSLRSASIDSFRGFAYFGTYTTPGRIVQVRLSDLTWTGTLALGAGEDKLWSSAIEPEKGFVYFGTDTSPGRIVRADIGLPVAVKILPVVLNTAGAGTSRFSSELTLSNRGATAATVELAYTAASFLKASGSGTATLTLGAGQQTIVPDAVSYLRDLGLPIPNDGSNQGGMLRVTFSGLSSPDVAYAGARTTTPSGPGRAGLSYPGVRPEECFVDSARLFGLRQNNSDRTNLALVNANPSSPITLRVTIDNADSSQSHTVTPDYTLGPGQWMQIGKVLDLAGFGTGSARVELTSGSGPFYAYAVFNDSVTNDGSYVPPQANTNLHEPQALPSLAETTTFSSELSLVNYASKTAVVTLAYLESLNISGGSGGTVSETLGPHEQRIIPDAIQHLRSKGISLGTKGTGSFAGALRATFTVDGTLDGGFVGARTSAPGSAGGQYGLFSIGMGPSAAATGEAWIFGLQQNSSVRSNLAVVNVGDASDQVTYQYEVYDGTTGQRVLTRGPYSLPPGGWTQYGTVLAPAGVSNGYARVVKLSGSSRFIAYGVVNDGASGTCCGTNDGSYIAFSNR